MNNECVEPDDQALRSLLREARPTPPLPPHFAEGVWRRIEREAIAAGPAATRGWLDRLVEVALRPRWALASLAAMVLVSGIAGVWSGTQTARHAAQERYLASVAPQMFETPR